MFVIRYVAYSLDNGYYSLTLVARPCCSPVMSPARVLRQGSLLPCPLPLPLCLPFLLRIALTTAHKQRCWQGLWCGSMATRVLPKGMA